MSEKLAIQTQVQGAKALVVLDGRLDVRTSVELDEAFNALPDCVKDIDCDFSGVYYVASAGIRVLLIAAKRCDDRGGKLRILHPSEEAVEPFGLANLQLVLDIVD